MDSREHRRVRMRLPLRLRWTTPFGQKIELGETIDVSRRGLLVSTREPHTLGLPLWVTFPYDSLGDGQPEMSARIVRCEEVFKGIHAANEGAKAHLEDAAPTAVSLESDRLDRTIATSDAPANFAVAIHFEEQAHASSNGNGHRREPERRSSPRRALAVPIRVRPERIPWFEQTMTIDFSAEGLRFRSHREYGLGDYLKVAFEDSTPTSWPGTGEFRSMVVRVAPAPDTFALDVGVCRIK